MLSALLAEATRTAGEGRGGRWQPRRALGSDARRGCRSFARGLLALHKSLLDDARATYEMDRGRVGSPGNLLQLVINDPWFAWLHQLSELVVRIDEATTARLGVHRGGCARHCSIRSIDCSCRPKPAIRSPDATIEALQRQPAVVLAHGAVKRVLKAT